MTTQGKIFQCVYMSQATDSFDESKDIDLILQKAYKYNPANQITGMLLFKGGIFLQLLEGPKEKVLILLEKIRNDQRHSRMVVTAELECNPRLFEDWTMAYKKLSQIDIDFINESLLPWGNFTDVKKTLDNQKLLELLKYFRFHLK